ncbi:MAG: class I SAM-dependent methyltransferase [Candidatus Phaeomarinobacter sp.]
MPDAHYDNPRLAAIYDLGNGWSEDSDYYLALAGTASCRVLDIGCGTGIITHAIAAKGHTVVGADPSPGMLAVAHAKPHGSNIRWVESEAQSLGLGETFDLIMMTGHAFQTLVEDADIRAAAATMKRHLAPGGRLVFESRNPRIDWPARWAYATELDTPKGVVRETREYLGSADDCMTFDLHYAFSDGVDLVSHSVLRFADRDTIEALFHPEGLAVEKVHGDWDGSPFDTASSPEMIFHFRHA